MTSIEQTASAFLEVCETGKGWEACLAYCSPNASFSSQAEPLSDMRTLAQYTNWMRDLFKPIPNGSYKVKAIGVDRERNSVSIFAVFSGTHTGDGGPIPPTGKATNADYVYVMEFDGEKIRHLTKIWNAGWSLRELGWA